VEYCICDCGRGADDANLAHQAKDAKGNARAGTPREAAEDADALLLAVHWSRIDDVLSQTGELSGKVILSCSLSMNADNTDLVIAHISSGAEALARRVPKARVVYAFNTVPIEALFGVFEARAAKRKGLASWTAGTIRAAEGLPLS